MLARFVTATQKNSYAKELDVARRFLMDRRKPELPGHAPVAISDPES
jgi:hypothetical protein